MAGVGAATLLATAMAMPVTAAPPGGTSRNITVTATTDVFDPLRNVTISAGEFLSFSVTVRNGGPQTVNNISLVFGLDDDPDPQANGDATPPTSFPSGVAVSENSSSCSGGQIVNCTIGTLGARKDFVVDVTITTTSAAPTGLTLVEAVASVAEAGGDSGYNIDTFSRQGDFTISPYDCDSVAAYRPGGGQFVSTPCDVSESNNQQSSVKLPAGLSTISITEGSLTDPIIDCPAVSGLSCIGDAVFADITGETAGNLISWEIRYDVTGLNVNTSKLVVYHYLNDGVTLSPTGGISLAKKNACSAKNTVNCGSASIDSQTNILTITFTTAGNGKTRLLG
jgi:hypothetical protein